jgi:Domain of unknown function (DUF1918)
MKALVGDRLVINGTNLGDRRRVGIVIGVAHPDGSPPYVVRWLEDDHESVVFPGPTAHLESRQPVGSKS